MKRFFDLGASFVGLILLSPLLLLIALLIKTSMPGPVLFRQQRTGLYGKAFTLYKFRSMIVSHHGSVVSVAGESRITPLGSRLRKFKLDELPELWNVLIGDMSLVGPRPDLPEFTDMLSGEEKKILSLRPGITGPASLKYKNEEDLLASVQDPIKFSKEIIWPEKVRMNLEYYHQRNFLKDIGIILKTIFGRSKTLMNGNGHEIGK